MTENTAHRDLLDEIATEVKGTLGEDAPTDELVEEMARLVSERAGEEYMAAQFLAHQEAVFQYLEHMENDNMVAAVMAVRDSDPAGIISILGLLARFWADMLRGDEEGVSIADMARMTFAAMTGQPEDES